MNNLCNIPTILCTNPDGNGLRCQYDGKLAVAEHYPSIYNKDNNRFACYTEQMHNSEDLTHRTGHDATVTLGQGSHHALGRLAVLITLTTWQCQCRMSTKTANLDWICMLRNSLYVQENIHLLKSHEALSCLFPRRIIGLSSIAGVCNSETRIQDSWYVYNSYVTFYITAFKQAHHY